MSKKVKDWMIGQLDSIDYFDECGSPKYTELAEDAQEEFNIYEEWVFELSVDVLDNCVEA